LARSLLDEPSWVRGRRVIDLGCGGGVVAVAACMAGAQGVWANDVDPMALRVAQANALHNGVVVEAVLGDLSAEPEVLSSGDVLLVSEMFYEGDKAPQFMTFLRRCRARGAEVLVADGGRPFAPAFTNDSGLELLRAEHVSTNFDLEGVSERWVRLGRLTEV
jgi:predicted nicotinamide N-methyase